MSRDTGAGRPAHQPKIDSTVAHNARVWDYWLGGKDNYAVDREVGDQIQQMFPVISEVARADRQFLARAVRYLAGEAGSRFFDRLELLAPGLVSCSLWRPERDRPARVPQYGAVGRKPPVPAPE